MKILGIETSCDETAASVVENGTKILANVVASSVEMHAKSGGIIPEVAAREQVRCIIPVIQEAIENCKLKIENLDAIAVTVGPGLIGSLLVGVETAKTLAYVWRKPLIPVNHLLGHIYASWLIEENTLPQFPLVSLIASGGHTDLVLMQNHAAPATLARSAGGRGQLRWLGGTRDDAAGECFDKCARVLGLDYPGGPAIAAMAAQFKIENVKFKIDLPRPMMNEGNFDFSFSGLKTAVIREVQSLKSNQQYSNLSIYQLAHKIQEAITDVLMAKTLRAAEKYQVKSIVLGGGVAANQRLREKMQHAIRDTQYVLYIPEPKLCTDNAAVIASTAYFNYHPVPWQKVTVLPGLSITGEI